MAATNLTGPTDQAMVVIRLGIDVQYSDITLTLL